MGASHSRAPCMKVNRKRSRSACQCHFAIEDCHLPGADGEDVMKKVLGPGSRFRRGGGEEEEEEEEKEEGE
jgi:hypothetical protein